MCLHKKIAFPAPRTLPGKCLPTIALLTRMLRLNPNVLSASLGQHRSTSTRNICPRHKSRNAENSHKAYYECLDSPKQCFVESTWLISLVCKGVSAVSLSRCCCAFPVDLSPFVLIEAKKVYGESKLLGSWRHANASLPCVKSDVRALNACYLTDRVTVSSFVSVLWKPVEAMPDQLHAISCLALRISSSCVLVKQHKWLH